MGCVSSSFLDDESSKVCGHHHIVSLTSSTYGLLSTLDTSTPPPPLSPLPSSISSLPRQNSEPEIINSWDLMAGLDPLTPPKPSKHNPQRTFDKQAVVLYTTTLQAIRKTFEDCNAVRAAFKGLGVCVVERDVSMDLEFREELRWLMGGFVALPTVFVGGRYFGGAEKVMQIHEMGLLGVIVEGLPKVRDSGVCDGCGGFSFVPCFRCSGSRKLVVSVGGVGKGNVVTCPDCNENGLMFCPICT